MYISTKITFNKNRMVELQPLKEELKPLQITKSENNSGVFLFTPSSYFRNNLDDNNRVG